MATPAAASAAMSVAKTNRGKDQIHWSEGVWKTLDQAVREEMMRTRVAAKFLPHVHVDKCQPTVASDIVIVPKQTTEGATSLDSALSVDESAVSRIQEYWTTFKLSVAQMEAEEQTEMALNNHAANGHAETPHPHESGHMATPHMATPHRASTAVSLALRTANILAQAEDLVLFNGQNAVANSPLFTGQLVQFLDPQLQKNLDLGLLQIKPISPAKPGDQAPNDIQLPLTQVIAVHPTVLGTNSSPPRYQENSLNAVASAFSLLQGLGHYEHYALALHTVPYADLHQALATTLIEPIEPVSHLIKAGIYGTGTLPPFTPSSTDSLSGVPTTINGKSLDFPPPGSAAATPSANVLYTGVLVSLSGNTVDHVRGRMEEATEVKDVVVTFNQKDQNEQYRFRVVQRFALRLKDPSAVILLLFMDS
jgi:hypothetical protein